MDREPLNSANVKRLLRECLDAGRVRFSEHALDEMTKDAITDIDVMHVLRAGVAEPGEYERTSWRYRVRAGAIVVVVAFAERAEVLTIVVTAWRRSS